MARLQAPHIRPIFDPMMIAHSALAKPRPMTPVPISASLRADTSPEGRSNRAHPLDSFIPS